MIGRLARWPWYPFVATAAPALYLASSVRVQEFRPVDVIEILVVMSVVTGLLVAASVRVFGTTRGGIATAVVSLCLWNAFQPLLSLLTIAVILAIFYRNRAQPESSFEATLSSYGNGLAATFLLTSLGLRLTSLAPTTDDLDPPRVVDLPGDARPDIWWILMDGHSRGDWLERRFGVEDRLGEGLRAREFQVPAASRANYGQTLYAVGSALNMGYLTELAGERPVTRDLADEFVRDSAVVASLAGAGYRTVYHSAGYRELDVGFEGQASVALAPSEIQLVLFEGSLFNWLWRSATGRDAVAELRWRFQTRAVSSIAPDSGSPAFHIVHLLAPHPPFVMRPDGELGPTGRSASTSDDARWKLANPAADYRKGYADQVAWVDGQVLAAVDRLTGDPDRPAVIVVSGDHGSGFDFDSVAPSGLAMQERLSTFWAVRLPVPPRSTVPPTMSPVNTFRYVFDEVFGSSLGLLPDRSFRQSWTRPEQIEDVTDTVHAPG